MTQGGGTYGNQDATQVDVAGGRNARTPVRRNGRRVFSSLVTEREASTVEQRVAQSMSARLRRSI